MMEGHDSCGLDANALAAARDAVLAEMGLVERAGGITQQPAWRVTEAGRKELADGR